ncbi:MAG: pseudouridine-5'-phosphate glycosidase [Betaproteobacteria bacterium]
MNPTHALLDIAPDVQAALAQGQAVVALESTIISHGMPYPQNVQTALHVEAEVRAHGAVPATVAIVQGRLKAGLSGADIERLGRAGHAVAKVSRRDMAFVVAAGADGATTVAATMRIAALAGIRVFATGGIGGVHRGAEHSFDISADLQELAQTPVAVVCAGAKSILDLRLTLEYLETQGVPLVGYQTDALPAFFTRESGFKVDYRLDSALAIAAAMRAQWAMGLPGGMVIANPIPAQYAMDRETIDGAIAQALHEAAQQGISGKASTPFLLARVNELTGGDSLAANIALVLNNARLAAAIALAYAAGANCASTVPGAKLSPL